LLGCSFLGEKSVIWERPLDPGQDDFLHSAIEPGDWIVLVPLAARPFLRVQSGTQKLPGRFRFATSRDFSRIGPIPPTT